LLRGGRRTGEDRKRGMQDFFFSPGSEERRLPRWKPRRGSGHDPNVEKRDFGFAKRKHKTRRNLDLVRKRKKKFCAGGEGGKEEASHGLDEGRRRGRAVVGGKTGHGLWGERSLEKKVVKELKERGVVVQGGKGGRNHFVWKGQNLSRLCRGIELGGQGSAWAGEKILHLFEKKREHD